MATANSTLSLPPLQVLDRAAAELVTEAGDDRATVNALNKAIWQFHEGLQIVPTHGGFLIRSFSLAGTIYRLDNVTGCSCAAGAKGKPCKHAAALHIVERAQRYAIPLSDRLAARRRVSYEQALAEMNELYA